MESGNLRIYLTGRIYAESKDFVLDEGWFRSRQARLLFAYLVCERSRPVPQDDLADVLWSEQLPASWDTALKSLVSRLRRFIDAWELDRGVATIISQFGCYELRLPHETWVDLEAAQNGIDEAEGALRAGEFGRAWGPTNVALTISRRAFLPGEDGDWVNSKRNELQEVQVRALDSYSDIALNTNQPSLAIKMAEEALSIESFRETGYQRLMRAHFASGNRAEALRVYDRCSTLLADELGVEPSSETEALYMDILKFTPRIK